MEEKPPPAKKTRSSVEPFNWRDSCLFCAEYCDIKHNNRKRVCKVETVELRTKILEVCEKYPEHPGFCSIAHRVCNCNDLVHVKAVYHKKCMGDFFHVIHNNNTTIDDEKKSVNEDQKPAKKPGKPKNPITEQAFQNTCNWFEHEETKSLREIEAHMAVLVGEANMWSRKHLQRKLVEKYGDSVNIQTEG